VSILKEKFFTKVEPYFHCSRIKSGDLKIEIETPPEPLLTRMLKFKMKCIRCSKTNQPFRVRQKSPLRKTSTAKHIYYACSCGNLGCSRGNAARDEYEAVGKHFNV
jgi:hypothetical protein